MVIKKRVVQKYSMEARSSWHGLRLDVEGKKDWKRERDESKDIYGFKEKQKRDAEGEAGLDVNGKWYIWGTVLGLFSRILFLLSALVTILLL